MNMLKISRWVVDSFIYKLFSHKSNLFRVVKPPLKKCCLWTPSLCIAALVGFFCANLAGIVILKH